MLSNILGSCLFGDFRRWYRRFGLGIGFRTDHSSSIAISSRPESDSGSGSVAVAVGTIDQSSSDASVAGELPLVCQAGTSYPRCLS